MQPGGDDPQTRSALAAHQVGALRWLGGGVIAVVLAALLGTAAAAMAGSSGRRVPAAGLVVVALVFIGIVAVGAGIGALLRTVRWRRALAAASWRTGTLRSAGPSVMAFEPDGSDESVSLRLLSTAIWRTRAVQGLDGAEVRAAPVGGGQWVLTADGLGTMVGARSVRRRS
ncbi:hypothetical protein [Blastococcus sp. CT_GayMR16]|uniref:hypothetical protein n=1 Tax=Blastococcus sp. CT_GayMR16 TaxID=2559607 RepID=UPI0010735927|nr:hypothetical protein [Blastococcus sp. CT_GayMR16]TFV90632.1 hypothetical protein E4P38_04270 [Blastococcus sp. CT_GayMR16]